jgi:hypothetical protein
MRDAPALDSWEAEGGAPRAAAATLPSAAEWELLQRLGAAIVEEWNDLPMPLQRALFAHAVGGNAQPDGDALKAQLARFLHDRKGEAAFG